jgi:hypothetical protein
MSIARDKVMRKRKEDMRTGVGAAETRRAEAMAATVAAENFMVIRESWDFSVEKLGEREVR